jgi:hypothetical protein
MAMRVNEGSGELSEKGNVKKFFPIRNNVTARFENSLIHGNGIVWGVSRLSGDAAEHVLRALMHRCRDDGARGQRVTIIRLARQNLVRGQKSRVVKAHSTSDEKLHLLTERVVVR